MRRTVPAVLRQATSTPSASIMPSRLRDVLCIEVVVSAALAALLPILRPQPKHGYAGLLQEA